MKSLRTRLLIAFILLSGLTAAAVAGAMYVQARTVILQKAQDAAVREFTDKVAKLVEVDPGPLFDRDDSAVMFYRGKPVPGTTHAADVPAELRQAARSGEVVWQRVSRDGQIGLVIGMRVSDVEIYSARSLDREQQDVGRVAQWALLFGGGSLVVAIGLALFAARGVLRPVRELQRAAHRLGEGDLTTRVQVRGSDELAAVARTFNNTAEALEKQVADARRFVADVSHELRTPLAAMTAVTDVLDEEAPHLSEDAGRAARLVSQETRNLTRLVNDLIEISRFDSGNAPLMLEQIDVTAAVHATLRARGWSDLITDQPAVLAQVDPRRLDVIVANLVGNAHRHGAPPIHVSVGRDGAWAVIEVTDHGPGLNSAVLPHVFDRFYKADTARTRSEGSGLGLAIAWENAQLHRGSLTAGNRPGGGAVFTLRLPAGGLS